MAMRALTFLVGALGLAASACGGTGSAPAPAPAPVVRATPPLTADDTVVATVDGRPVWGSCVATQARAMTGTDEQRRRAARDQCIAFELLARSAETRGLATAPEVVEAARTAEVNRLVETDFEHRYRTPADLAPQIDLVLKANPWLPHVLELRGSSFARFVVPKGAPPALEDRAHALADRLAAELAGQTGLFGVHLFEAARRIADASGVKLDASDFRPAPRDDLVDAYAAALYAIPEVGRASPAFRSPWGWDVVVWTGGNAARERPRDEVVADLFPEVRRRQFLLWANQIGKQLGVHIAVDDAAVARLDTAGTGGTGGTGSK
jgi:hypothetical protein